MSKTSLRLPEFFSAKQKPLLFFYLPNEPPYIMLTKVAQYMSFRIFDVYIVYCFDHKQHNLLTFQCGLTPVWIPMSSVSLTYKWTTSGGKRVFFGLKRAPNTHIIAFVV